MNVKSYALNLIPVPPATADNKYVHHIWHVSDEHKDINGKVIEYPVGFTMVLTTAIPVNDLKIKGDLSSALIGWYKKENRLMTHKGDWADRQRAVDLFKKAKEIKDDEPMPSYR